MKPWLRYPLRTLVGPWVALVAVGLEAANFLQRGMPWVGEGMWTVEWFAITLFILGPVCAGAAAVDASRLTRPGNIHLVRAVRRPRLPYVWAAAWCAVPVMVVHIGAIASGLVLGRVTSPSVGWLWLCAAAAVQMLVIGWFVALGSVIGRFSSPIVAGILGAATGFAMTFVLSSVSAGEPTFALLNQGAATVSRVGFAYSHSFLAVQASLLVATAGMFLLVGVRSRSGLVVPTVGGGAMAAASVGLLIYPVMNPHDLPSQRLLDAPEPPAVCWTIESGTNLCMFGEHSRFHDQAAQQLDRLVQAARENGYGFLVAERVEETSGTYYPQDPRTTPLTLDFTYEKGSVTIDDLVYGLISPTHCTALFAEVSPPDWYFESHQRLFVTWLLLVGVDANDPNDIADPELDWIMQETPALTPQQARDVKTAFDRCDLGGNA